MKSPIKVAVTGAGGQIGYALIFRLASGAVFGPDQPVSLGLLEITPALPSLNGTLMELEDCAFPLLHSVQATDKAEEAFGDADWVILVGGLPRKDGMTRADLIRANGPIFTGQGQAINAAAGPNVRVLTVANPCNTNCLIARSHAPKVPGRSLVRHDPARPEPRRLAARQEGRRPRGRGQEGRHLGQPLRHPVPRLRERHHRRQARPAGHRRPLLVHRRLHPHGGQARLGRHQGSRRVLGRLRRQRGARQRPLGLVRHALGRLVQRRASCPTAPTGCLRA